MVEAVGGRLRGCGGAVHHAMPTPNCNTSNTRVFDPYNPPTSGPQHLLASHLIHRTVEQCILVLLLLPTNIPLDCVAPMGGYVGDLQVQDRGYLTSFSIDGEHCLNTSSEATQSLSNVLRVDSNGWSCKTVQAILMAVFLIIMHSSPISSVPSCRSA